jgi:hypothetical protein
MEPGAPSAPSYPKMARRVPNRVVAAVAIAVMGAVVAIVLPMYTCRTGNLEFYGGEPTCIASDLGYRPDSWLPTKITVAVAGLVTALAILVWRRWPQVSIGIAFAAQQRHGSSRTGTSRPCSTGTQSAAGGKSAESGSEPESSSLDHSWARCW